MSDFSTSHPAPRGSVRQYLMLPQRVDMQIYLRSGDGAMTKNILDIGDVNILF